PVSTASDRFAIRRSSSGTRGHVPSGARRRPWSRGISPCSANDFPTIPTNAPPSRSPIRFGHFGRRLPRPPARLHGRWRRRNQTAPSHLRLGVRPFLVVKRRKRSWARRELKERRGGRQALGPGRRLAEAASALFRPGYRQASSE